MNRHRVGWRRFFQTSLEENSVLKQFVIIGFGLPPVLFQLGMSFCFKYTIASGSEF